MKRSKGRTLAFSVVFTGVFVLVAAGVTLKDSLRERWYLWKLSSEDENERTTAAKGLAEMRSVKAVPLLKKLRARNELLKIAGIGHRELGFCSHALELNGMGKAEVVRILGEPDEKLVSNLREPTYGRPRQLPKCDEQWVYGFSLAHIYVYFDRETVALSLEEWSSF